MVDEEEKKEVSPQQDSGNVHSERKKEESKQNTEAPAAMQAMKKEDEDSDEEITIDFSKIKNIFKRKKKVKEETKPEKKKKDSQESKEDEDSDEEISIDFSKIKKIFKGSEEDEQEPKEKSKDGSDDELNIDFSKIKKIFKQSSKSDDKDKDEISIDFGKLKNIKNIFKGGKDDESESGDDINIDWKKIGGFVKKYSLLFLILIPLFLAIDIRMESKNWPITDNWARDSVINNIRNQVSSQISQQYPNLPAQNREALIQAELDKTLKSNWPQIQQQIQGTSNFFKDHFKNDQGIEYMPDIDTYYWFRYAQNILDRGHPGDELRDGKPFDNHQLAPKGRFVTKDMFPSYFLSYFHSFLRIFNSDISLMQSMSLYPVLVASLATIFVFLIALKITNGLGAVFAAILFSVNSTFLGRSLYGHADSDAWTLFFPLLITWLFFEIFDRKKLRSVILLAILAGMSIGLFSFAWSGWWYIFDFILITVIASLAYSFIAGFKEFRKDWRNFLKRKEVSYIFTGVIIFFVVSLIGVSIAANSSTFFQGLLGPIAFSTIKAPVFSDLWPNVLTTVAELNEGSIGHAINSVGGKFMFFLSLIGILLILVRKFNMRGIILLSTSIGFYAWLVYKGGGVRDITFLGLLMIPWAIAILFTLLEKGHERNIKFAIILILWYVSSIYAVSKGVRFALLLAPAFAVALGTTIGVLYIFFNKWLSKELHIHKIISSSMLIILFGVILIGPVKGAYGTASNDIPIVNDVWWNSLTAIKTNSSEDAIITSWWDFGHHFKAIADRPVTFDGTTQTSIAARWVGKLFMISNERESLGILRKLDCSGGSAFPILNEHFESAAATVRVLDSLTPLSEGEARKILIENGVGVNTAREILRLTHCEPPEGYLIASGDMIGKSGVWAHFGSWNFERADVWYNLKDLSIEEASSYMIKNFGYTKEKAENIYLEANGISSDTA